MKLSTKQLTCPSAFTLIEVVASVTVLVLILSGIVVGYNRMVTRVYEQSLRERALAVAQRQIEMIMGSDQEPEGTGLSGPDEIDPIFNWEMELKRVPVNEEEQLNIKNSIIQATVTVSCNQPTASQQEPVRIQRYFSNLKPRPGQQYAVPIPSQYEEEMWFVELRQRLGRDPTPQEVLTEFLKNMETPDEIMEELEGDG